MLGQLAAPSSNSQIVCMKVHAEMKPQEQWDVKEMQIAGAHMNDHS